MKGIVKLKIDFSYKGSRFIYEDSAMEKEGCSSFQELLLSLEGGISEWCKNLNHKTGEEFCYDFIDTDDLKDNEVIFNLYIMAKVQIDKDEYKFHYSQVHYSQVHSTKVCLRQTNIGEKRGGVREAQSMLIVKRTQKLVFYKQTVGGDSNSIPTRGEIVYFMALDIDGQARYLLGFYNKGHTEGANNLNEVRGALEDGYNYDDLVFIIQEV